MIEFLETLLPDRIISALGYTFMHSLWIGALLSLLLFLLLMLMRGSNPRNRYAVSVSVLFAFLAANLLVFVLYAFPADVIHDKASKTIIQLGSGNFLIAPAEVPGNENLLSIAKNYLIQNQALLVLLWLSGIMLLGLRFLGGLIYSQRMKNYAIRPVSEKILQKSYAFSKKLKLSQKVKVLESRLVKVPLVLGYFRPVILIPTAVLLQVPFDQIEAILAHELAHVKRRDNLINLLQSIVEIVFFYHPATWWISGLIRKEREEVCDDMALEICPDRLNYAKALMNLENSKQDAENYALAFTGRKNTLVNRIKRLMMKKEGRTNYFAGVLASLAIMAAMALLSTRADAFGPADRQVINTSTMDQSISNEKVPELLSQPDTIQKNQVETNENLVIHTTHGGKNVVLHKQNGEISNLEIDGKKIDPVNYSEYNDLIDELEQEMQAGHEKRIVIREQHQKEREKMLEERREIEKEMQEEMRVQRIEKELLLDSLHKTQRQRAERMRIELLEQNALQKEEIREMIEAQIEQLKKIKNDTNLLKEYYGMGRRPLHPSSPYIVVPDNENVFEYRFFSEPELPEMPEIPEIEEELKWLHLKEIDEPRVYVDVEKELQHPTWKKSFMEGPEGSVFIYKSQDRDRAGFNKSITMQRLRNELKKDELIDLFGRPEVYLTKKELIVDGEKQPRKLMKKYRDMYEALSGKEIGKDEIIEIQ